MVVFHNQIYVTSTGFDQKINVLIKMSGLLKLYPLIKMKILLSSLLFIINTTFFKLGCKTMSKSTLSFTKWEMLGGDWHLTLPKWGK